MTKKEICNEMRDLINFSMTDLITDIYAVNMAMYLDDHMLEMPDEFRKIGKEFLINRNMSFMIQHMQEVYLGCNKARDYIREEPEKSKDDGISENLARIG